jgi:hypothetical protein
MENNNSTGHHTWNHRVMKRVTKYGTYYGVHEVYYDSEGKVEGYTAPVSVVGESIEEIKQYLEMILNCLDKDILDYDDEEEKKDEILRQKIEEGLESGLSDFDFEEYLKEMKDRFKEDK